MKVSTTQFEYMAQKDSHVTANKAVPINGTYVCKLPKNGHAARVQLSVSLRIAYPPEGERRD